MNYMIRKEIDEMVTYAEFDDFWIYFEWFGYG